MRLVNRLAWRATAAPALIFLFAPGARAPGVNYSALVGVLVQANKEQQRKIEAQDAELKVLQAGLDRVEALGSAYSQIAMVVPEEHAAAQELASSLLLSNDLSRAEEPWFKAVLERHRA